LKVLMPHAIVDSFLFKYKDSGYKLNSAGFIFIKRNTDDTD